MTPENMDAGDVVDEETIDTITTAVNESIPAKSDDGATTEASGGLVQLEAEQLLEMTIAELKVYADQRQIDLGSAKRKGDIVDAILGGVDLSHYGPVLDELLGKASIPIDRVISRHFQIGKTTLSVGWFDQHGTPVGRFLNITPHQADQIRDELNDFALRGLDTLGDAVRDQ